MSLKKASRTKSLSLSDDFPMRVPKPKILLTTATTAAARKVEETGKILRYIDENIIGKGVAFLGPYGRRKVVYADYFSSGRSLQFLEDYINKEVLPAFGDTSCISAVTGLQSQLYSKEAKDLVRSAVNASNEDHVFFCEGLSTSLSERLCYMLCYQNENFAMKNETEETLRPVLFVSTNESDKNLAPWLNAGAEVIRIAKTPEGFLDLVDLEKKLASYSSSKRLLIGLFAGASRLTGILADDVATTILLHQYDALAVWDYSSGAPFASIDMNPHLPGAAKDVLFFSTSKFIGGVQGPGVIVIKKQHISMNFIEPTIGAIDAVRAGLVIQLKDSLGAQTIANKQEKICKQILSHVRTIPEIVLLGSTQTTAKRIPTICFLVKHPRGSFLHHRFVVSVLNDVFGIQATAGNHIGEALGINKKLTVEYERLLSGNDEDDTNSHEHLRPGYTKLLIPFFMSDSEIGFILEALKMVATEAWKLLPQYEVDKRTGEWRHHSNSLVKERKWLGSIRYIDGKMLFTDRRISGPGTFPQNYADCLQTARNLFNRARKMAQKTATPYLELKLRNSTAEVLRWYMLSGEAHELLLGHSQNVKNSVPFNPNKAKVSDIPSLLTMFRHNSLSALDVKRFKSRSLPTSPIQIPVKRQQSSPIRPETTKTTSLIDCSSPPIVRFSLGGEVTTLTSFSSPRVATLINSEEGVSSRNRCYSWSSSLGGTKITSSSSSVNLQKRINIGLIAANHKQQIQSSHRAKNKQRTCSCSSQTDLFSPDSVDNLSPTPSLQNSVGQAGSTCSDCTEEIQAYVAEVTKELATEIKSEIRGVISKVKDVLEYTDTMDMNSYNISSLTNLNSNDDSRSDSVSASHVAEYLKEYSKEMASEVKSEIREAVSEIITTDSLNSSRRNSPPENRTAKNLLHNHNNHRKDEKLIRKRYSDITSTSFFGSNFKRNGILHEESNKIRSESFPRPNSTPGWHHHHPTAPSPESSTPNCPYTGAISKLVDPVSTASQDSGINMCFHDSDEIRSRTLSENAPESRHKITRRSQSDSVSGPRLDFNSDVSLSVLSDVENCDCNHTSNNDSVNCLSSSTPTKQMNSQEKKVDSTKLTTQTSSFSSIMISNNNNNSANVGNNSNRRQPSESEQDQELARWHHLPKDVWKQTAEAIDEYNMIKDGDRILICLSGSSASLCLLHAIRQFSRARGIHIEMAAITVGKCGIDPRALMLYMRDLSIELFIEPLEASESYKTKISSVARRKKYNVLAMGNTLDKLAEEFLFSMLYKGKLYAAQAHSRNREGDLRVIRPFIYIRERLLEDFAMQKNLPTRPSSKFTRPYETANCILQIQELSNPMVYENVKNTLKPLLAIKLENQKTCYEYLKFALISRD